MLWLIEVPVVIPEGIDPNEFIWDKKFPGTIEEMGHWNYTK